MHRDRHVSLWPSVSVCSLIRPGNSTGPRSEGEQKVPDGLWEGCSDKENKMDREKKKREVSKPKEEEHVNAHAQTIAALSELP